jgi:hypothetical protein
MLGLRNMDIGMGTDMTGVTGLLYSLLLQPMEKCGRVPISEDMNTIV